LKETQEIVAASRFHDSRFGHAEVITHELAPSFR
jgi:hypothetical protein